MKRLRVVVALVSCLSVGACQTAASAGNGLAVPAPLAGAAAAPGNPTAPFNNAARAGISRPASKVDGVSTSAFASSRTRTVVVVAVVVAVVILGVVLLGGGDELGSGY